MDVRVATLIYKDGKFLLVQEATSIIYGLWNWSQGKVDDGESYEDAAVREVKEETGFNIKIKEKITIIKNPFPGTKEIHVFLGEIETGEISFDTGEILQVKWFTFEEITEMKDKLTGERVYKTISYFLYKV